MDACSGAWLKRPFSFAHVCAHLPAVPLFCPGVSAMRPHPVPGSAHHAIALICMHLPSAHTLVGLGTQAGQLVSRACCCAPCSCCTACGRGCPGSSTQQSVRFRVFVPRATPCRTHPDMQAAVGGVGVAPPPAPPAYQPPAPPPPVAAAAPPAASIPMSAPMAPAPWNMPPPAAAPPAYPASMPPPPTMPPPPPVSAGPPPAYPGVVKLPLSRALAQPCSVRARACMLAGVGSWLTSTRSVPLRWTLGSAQPRLRAAFTGVYEWER